MHSPTPNPNLTNVHRDLSLRWRDSERLRRSRCPPRPSNTLLAGRRYVVSRQNSRPFSNADALESGRNRRARTGCRMHTRVRLHGGLVRPLPAGRRFIASGQYSAPPMRPPSLPSLQDPRQQHIPTVTNVRTHIVNTRPRAASRSHQLASPQPSPAVPVQRAAPRARESVLSLHARRLPRCATHSVAGRRSIASGQNSAPSTLTAPPSSLREPRQQHIQVGKDTDTHTRPRATSRVPLPAPLFPALEAAPSAVPVVSRARDPARGNAFCRLAA